MNDTNILLVNNTSADLRGLGFEPALRAVARGEALPEELADLFEARPLALAWEHGGQSGSMRVIVDWK